MGEGKTPVGSVGASKGQPGGVAPAAGVSLPGRLPRRELLSLQPLAGPGQLSSVAQPRAVRVSPCGRVEAVQVSGRPHLCANLPSVCSALGKPAKGKADTCQWTAGQPVPGDTTPGAGLRQGWESWAEGRGRCGPAARAPGGPRALFKMQSLATRAGSRHGSARRTRRASRADAPLRRSEPTSREAVPQGGSERFLSPRLVTHARGTVGAVPRERPGRVWTAVFLRSAQSQPSSCPREREREAGGWRPCALFGSLVCCPEG